MPESKNGCRTIQTDHQIQKFFPTDIRKNECKMNEEYRTDCIGQEEKDAQYIPDPPWFKNKYRLRADNCRCNGRSGKMKNDSAPICRPSDIDKRPKPKNKHDDNGIKDEYG
jgi:hypothetical protein